MCDWTVVEAAGGTSAPRCLAGHGDLWPFGAREWRSIARRIGVACRERPKLLNTIKAEREDKSGAEAPLPRLPAALARIAEEWADLRKPRGRPFSARVHYHRAHLSQSLDPKELATYERVRVEHVRMSVGWAGRMWSDPDARLRGERPSPTDRTDWRPHPWTHKRWLRDHPPPTPTRRTASVGGSLRRIRPDIHARFVAHTEGANR